MEVWIALGVITGLAASIGMIVGCVLAIWLSS